MAPKNNGESKKQVAEETISYLYKVQKQAKLNNTYFRNTCKCGKTMSKSKGMITQNLV